MVDTLVFPLFVATTHPIGQVAELHERRRRADHALAFRLEEARRLRDQVHTIQQQTKRSEPSELRALQADLHVSACWPDREQLRPDMTEQLVAQVYQSSIPSGGALEGAEQDSRLTLV